MNLYKINPRIAELAELLEADPETGVISADVEWVCKEIESLEDEKESKLKSIALAYIEAKASANAAKAEKMRLANLQSTYENKAKRLLATMDYFAQGKKLDLGVAKVSYRTSKSLAVDDCKATAEWLEHNGYLDFVTYSAPTISKNDVKKLVASGNEIPGCRIEESVSCSIK